MIEQDFSQENRNSGIWATDARKIIQGHAVQVWLEKTSRATPEDISDIEAVQMGKIMQEPIMRAAADRFGLRFKNASYEMTSKTMPWMKSHFDYLSEDGKTLYEVKNYNAATHKKFDDESGSIPAADQAQCIHEAIVHGIDQVVLIVLFGGQALRKYDVDVTGPVRHKLIEDEEDLWQCILDDQAPSALDAQGAAFLFREHVPGKALRANANQVLAARQLSNIKASIKELEAQEQALRDIIMPAMQDAEALLDVDGATLITWRTTKPGSSFNSSKFKEAYPQMYEQFVFPTPSQRRFLVK